MAHKFEGADYRSTQNLNNQQLKAVIRDDVKRFLKCSANPVKGAKLTGCRANNRKISLEITVPDDAPYNHARTFCNRFHALYVGGFNHYTRGATGPCDLLQQGVAELAQAYNFDDSDSQSDYFHCRFYLDVTIKISDAAKLHAESVFLDLCAECDFDLSKPTNSYPTRVIDFLAGVGLSR